MSQTTTRHISLKDAIGYGIGDFYGGGQGALTVSYLALFWTRYSGLSIATAQAILGMSAMISALAALVFGILDDNLYRFRIGRKFGRRRIILLVTSPLILTGIVMWIPDLPVWMYALAYMLWVVLAQLFGTAYSALPGEMSGDFADRTKLSTVRLCISTAAGTSIPLIFSAVLSIIGEAGPQGYMLCAITITICFSAAVLYCWKNTWEMSVEQAGFADFQNRGKQPFLWSDVWRRTINIAREYASTLRIRVFRQHLALYLLIMIAMDVFGQTFVFFVVYNWMRPAAFASLLLGCTVISLPLMPLFSWLLVQVGPRKLYTASFVGCLSGTVFLAIAWVLVGRIDVQVWTIYAVVAALWFFACKALCGYLPWAVFPFISDVDQIVTKRYRTSTFIGIQAAIRQLLGGIVMIGVGFVLASSGFDAALSVQSRTAQVTLACVTLGWFAVSMVLCWLIVRNFKLSKQTDGVVLAEIARLSAGGEKCDVSEQTRTVVESLTGVAYEDCWK